MMAPVTKYTRQVVNTNFIPARVREAFRIAAEERPGATHLELPEDILQKPCELSPPASFTRAARSSRCAATAAS